MRKLLLILSFAVMACGSTIPITDKLIYVRVKAGTNYKVLTTLDFYTLTGRESNTRDRAIWYQVKTHKGIIGWVNARLIREYCGIRW
jgi:uncharacterized protein YgiM (DUF1202 family)